MNKQTKNVLSKHGEDILAVYWKKQSKLSACSKATEKQVDVFPYLKTRRLCVLLQHKYTI